MSAEPPITICQRLGTHFVKSELDEVCMSCGTYFHAR